jgi:hypothetical protein
VTVYTVVVSSVMTGLVRRRSFLSYGAADRFANRHYPASMRREGYRVEVERVDPMDLGGKEVHELLTSLSEADLDALSRDLEEVA